MNTVLRDFLFVELENFILPASHHTSANYVVSKKKSQNNDPLKNYKRAHNKYYARLMKDFMTQEEFKAWADDDAAERDDAFRHLQRESISKLYTAEIFRELREKLNRK